MFILDSLLIAGIRWSLETALTAAEAEMNDDSVLREQLLEAEMRREMGEISDADFEVIEADLLGRIRDIKERREGGGPLAFSGQPMETTGDSTFQVEASVSGDFHDPGAAPHTTIVHHGPRGGDEIAVLDIEPGSAAPPVEAAADPDVRRARQRRAGRGLAAGAARDTLPVRSPALRGAAAAPPRASTRKPARAARRAARSRK